jgi:hypothetical protein
LRYTAVVISELRGIFNLIFVKVCGGLNHIIFLFCWARARKKKKKKKNKEKNGATY